MLSESLKKIIPSFEHARLVQKTYIIRQCVSRYILIICCLNNRGREYGFSAIKACKPVTVSHRQNLNRKVFQRFTRFDGSSDSTRSTALTRPSLLVAVFICIFVFSRAWSASRFGFRLG